MEDKTKKFQDMAIEILESIEEACKEVENLKPLLKLVLETIEYFGPEFATIPDDIIDWIVARRIKTIALYEESGFTREEAILMTLDGKVALQTYISNLPKKA